VLEIAIPLIVGFALGYGAREWVSRQRGKRRDGDARIIRQRVASPRLNRPRSPATVSPWGRRNLAPLA
jgi:hypothetical protein